jgi:hypothetical protein
MRMVVEKEYCIVEDNGLRAPIVDLVAEFCALCGDESYSELDPSPYIYDYHWNDYHVNDNTPICEVR